LPVDVAYEDSYDTIHSSEDNKLKFWMDFKIVSDLRDQGPRL